MTSSGRARSPEGISLPFRRVLEGALSASMACWFALKELEVVYKNNNINFEGFGQFPFPVGVAPLECATDCPGGGGATSCGSVEVYLDVML